MQFVYLLIYKGYVFLIFRETMNNQLAELLAEPSEEFDNFIRMSHADFEHLVQQISPKVSKQDTDWREAIPVKYDSH